MKIAGKFIKKALALSLSLATVISIGFGTSLSKFIGTNISVNAWSNYKTYGDFEYEINSDNTATITRYKGNGGSVTIPSTLNGMEVTCIGEHTEQLEPSLDVISYGAFEGCVDVIRVTIPDNVKFIGHNAFSRCTHLISVIMSNSLTEISPATFSYCTNLTNIIIPKSVTKIGNSAFENCTSLTNIIIPSSVIKIDRCAFSCCKSLKNITIPNSVTEIGGGVFGYCDNLENINVTSDNNFYSSENGVLFDNDKKILIAYPAGRKGDYVIPNGVKEIGYSSFSHCKSLTQITIPNSVTNINGYSFYNTNLRNVDIPNSVMTIGQSAFHSCTELTKINISDSVLSISDFAFYNCSSLTEVVIPNGVNEIGTKAFGECTNLKSIIIPSSVTKMGSSVFYKNNKQLTVYGDKGSYAETYAKNYRLNFLVFKDIENVSSLSSDTIVLDRDVKVYPKAEGGKGGYTYAVYYKKKTETAWNKKQDFSSNTSVSITPRFLGEYEILVKAKDVEGNVDEKILTVNVIEPFKAELKISDKNVFLGNSVTLTANATGGYGDYTYAFYYRKATDETWTTKQNFSTNNSITLKPVYETEYEICVKVKDKSGDLQKVYNKFNVSKVSPLTNTSVLTKSSINLGEYATVKCSSTGGIAPYQYAVYYKKKTDTNWTAKQSFSENTTVTFKPVKAVDYDVCIKAKDSIGTVSKKYLSLKVIQNNVVNTSALVSSSILLGSSATVKCSATSGTSPYQYAVYYKKENDPNWYEVQSFDENATVTFKPLKALTYHVCVKAKDKNNTVDKKYFTLNVTQPISNLSLNAYLASSNINKGDTAVAICSAKDGIEPYKYALYAKKSTSSYWSTIQDFNSNSVITYKPADIGNYDICVKVKDNSSKVDKQYLTLTVK